MFHKQNKLVLVIVMLLFCNSLAIANGLCLPRNNSASNKWPICGIYIHGLFGSAPYSEVLYEIPYRNSLEVLANNLQCRIAVPFGNLGKYRNWNNVPLNQIMLRASGPCKGSSFIDHPDIIGFSNGANSLRKFSCNELSMFHKVTLVGPTGNNGNDIMKKCGNVQIHQKHEVLSIEDLRKAIIYKPMSNSANDYSQKQGSH
jgi:hypothetical protein